jgi:hypothetical protein
MVDEEIVRLTTKRPERVLYQRKERNLLLNAGREVNISRMDE